MSEEVSGFGRGDEVADVSGGLPERVEGSSRRAPEMGLELCEGHLDRIEVGAVGRQEQEPGAPVCEASGRVGALVDGEIVEDDDIALRQGRASWVST